MGDRTYSYYDCPKCGKKDGVEMYDAPSCLQYFEHCKHCDYKVDIDYYEAGLNVLVLLSKEEAKKRGYICKKCDNYLQIDERKKDICPDCKDNNYKIKVTCDLINKLKPYWQMAKNTEAEYHDSINKIEKEIQKTLDFNAEIFKCDGEIAGIGNYERTMRLIHGVELKNENK